MFDGADTNATTGQRPVSTTPLQALFMMNDPFAHEQAGKFASRLAALNNNGKRIDMAYQLAFGRKPTGDEIKSGEEYLKACEAELKCEKDLKSQRADAALASYCRVLFSSNEFMFVD
jgi:hypothetical protein